MTERPSIPFTAHRLALPNRPYCLMLNVPTGRKKPSNFPATKGNSIRKKSPGAETASFKRYRQGPVATSVTTAIVLSP